VSNDFKQTLDSMNDYMTTQQYPKELRVRLREYIMLSEPVFRFNYYNALLDRLSPGLQAVVAQQNHGAVINRVPFFVYAVHTFYDLKPGDVVQARAPRRKGGGAPAWERRRARVLRITPSLKYDVEYVEEFPATKELSVPFSRLQLDEYVLSDSTDPRIRERVNRLPYQRNLLVFDIARALKLELRMARDAVVLANTSLNDTLYVVRTGSVIIFGADVLRPFSVSRVKEGEYFGDDIAMLVRSADPDAPPAPGASAADVDRPNAFTYRRFSAKCSRTTQLHSLDGGAFHRIVIGPAFPIFRRYIARYGVWMRLRNTVIDHVRRVKRFRARDRSRRLQADVGTPSAPGAPPASWMNADPYDAVAARRDRAVTPPPPPPRAPAAPPHPRATTTRRPAPRPPSPSSPRRRPDRRRRRRRRPRPIRPRSTSRRARVGERARCSWIRRGCGPFETPRRSSTTAFLRRTSTRRRRRTSSRFRRRRAVRRRARPPWRPATTPRTALARRRPLT
jgi:hypothetical protein